MVTRQSRAKLVVTEEGSEGGRLYLRVHVDLDNQLEDMLTNTMFSLTRFFASRVASTAFRTPKYVGFQRIPLSTPFRAFTAGNPTLLAPAVKEKTTRRASGTKSTSKPKSKTKPQTKPKTKPKIKAKTAAASKGRTRAKPKTRATAKPKKVAAKEKPSTRVPLKDRPPTKPVGAFFLYLRRVSSRVGKSMAESQAATRDAAATWRNMSDAEKQVFRDEAKVLLEDHNIQRVKWYKDPKNAAVLRKLNKDRVKRGKHRIHAPSGLAPKKPLTSFFRYLQELRSTDAFSKENVPANTTWVTWSAREAGVRWKALPPSEKDKYVQAYQSDVSKSS